MKNCFLAGLFVLFFVLLVARPNVSSADFRERLPANGMFVEQEFLALEIETFDISVAVSIYGGKEIFIAYPESDDVNYFLYDFDFSSGTLKLTQSDFHNFEAGTLKVFIPVWEREFNYINIKTVSGSANLDSFISRNDVRVETDSGSIEASGLVMIGVLDLSTVSGAINVDAIISARDIFLKSVSGTLNANDAQASNIQLHSNSGFLSANGLVGAIAAMSPLGDIRIKDVVGSVNLASTSGAINANELAGSAIINARSSSVLLQNSILSGARIINHSGFVTLENVKINEEDLLINTVSGTIKIN